MTATRSSSADVQPQAQSAAAADSSSLPSAASGIAGPEAHSVQGGRPDFAALVRASSGLAHERESRPRLVHVAACGPATLVEAARSAVASVRKECRDVPVEFCGEEKW
eukprot:343217-Prymnesium_polylepis.1